MKTHITKVKLHKQRMIQKRLGEDFAPCEVELSPGVNLIIGKNGSGKSTFVQAIRSVCFYDKELRESWESYEWRKSSTLVWNDGSETSAYDKDLPAWFYDGIADDRKNSPVICYDSVAIQMAAMKSSHGERVLIQTIHTVEKAILRGPGFLCLDEIDGSLDFHTILKISELDNLVKKGLQVLIVSHHPLFLLRGLENGWKIMETSPKYASKIVKFLGRRDLLGKASKVESAPWVNSKG